MTHPNNLIRPTDNNDRRAAFNVETLFNVRMKLVSTLLPLLVSSLSCLSASEEYKFKNECSSGETEKLAEEDDRKYTRSPYQVDPNLRRILADEDERLMGRSKERMNVRSDDFANVFDDHDQMRSAQRQDRRLEKILKRSKTLNQRTEGMHGLSRSQNSLRRETKSSRRKNFFANVPISDSIPIPLPVVGADAEERASKEADLDDALLPHEAGFDEFELHLIKKRIARKSHEGEFSARRSGGRENYIASANEIPTDNFKDTRCADCHLCRDSDPRARVYGVFIGDSLVNRALSGPCIRNSVEPESIREAKPVSDDKDEPTVIEILNEDGSIESSSCSSSDSQLETPRSKSIPILMKRKAADGNKNSSSRAHNFYKAPNANNI